MDKKQTEQAKLLKNILEFGDDQTGKTLFKFKRYLAEFLKLVLPIFKDITINEIIEQTIDWNNEEPGFLAKLQSEESNTRKGPQLREDLVLLLRYPNYMQAEGKERYFIAHFEFENSDSDLKRREAEYMNDLYYRYNISPYETEEERKENTIPIYSFWTLLSPSKKNKGTLVERNYETVYKADKEDATLKFQEVREKDSALMKSYKIYIDDNLSEAQKEIPNLFGLLQGFSKNLTEEEFKKWIETYDLVDIPEFTEEVEIMNGFKQAFVDQGIKIGIDQGIKQGINQGINQGIVIGEENKQRELIENLAQSLLKNGTCETLSDAIDKAMVLLQIDKK